MKIRKYTELDNLGWVRCRVLSFLDTAYFDDVFKEKEYYNNPAIELVAEIDNKIVGLIDIEYETKKGDVCYKVDEIGGVIWHLAVLPEYRNRGVASALLKEAISLLSDKGIKLIQAWTRDDKWVNDWYVNKGFVLQEDESYLHVYAKHDDYGIRDLITESQIKDLHVRNCYFHYVGKDKEEIKKKVKRVHTCNLYEFILKN